MSSATETQSSFDDVIEFPSAGHPLTFPIIVSEHFPRKTVARAFRIDGGGDAVLRTAAGEDRPLTALENPYFNETKITAIVSATAATKVRLFV